MVMTERILIAIDMQNDFIDGALGSTEAVKIVSKVKQLINDFAKSGDSIIFTQDTHDNNYLDTLEGKKLQVPHCIINTDGWKIHVDLLSDLDKDQYITVTKNTFGLSSDEWNKIISGKGLLPSEYWDLIADKKPKEIIIIGLCTDICVITNALNLRTCFPNTIIKIVEDATAGTTPERKEAALEVARSCQIDII